MSAVPLLDRPDRAAVVAAVGAEARGLDLAGAVLHDEGHENLVLRTVDGWIVRLARREEADLDREVAVLALLDGRLPVPVPRVAWTGVHHRMMAYRALDGVAFDADAFRGAGDDLRDALAASLADVLVAMHASLSAEEISAVGIPATDLAADLEHVTAHLDAVPPDVRGPAGELAEHFRAAWVDDPPDEPDVLLHHDVHLRNMVLAHPVGPVTGLWDFSCVRTGPPTLDLRYLTGVLGRDFPCRVGRTDLVRRVAAAYGERTGIELDVARAGLAARFEDLADAVRAEDPALVRQAVLQPRG